MLSPGSTYTEEFPAAAESVPRARAEVTCFAQAAGADSHQLDSIRLAASEAITNIVQHAYRGGRGTFQVVASYVPNELWLLIGDDGVGLQRQGRRARGGLGLGLVLIAQLADDFEIVRRSTGGTQLQMRFKLKGTDESVSGRPKGRKATSLSPA